MNTPRIAFWFDLGSPYSHLSAARIEALADKAAVQVDWYPFLLGPIFKSMGWKDSPFNEQPLKRDYMWLDVARQARKYGMAFKRPSVFPRRALSATRLAVAGEGAPWLPEFCRRVMAQNFVDDLEIDSLASIESTLGGLVEDSQALIEMANHESTKQRTRQRTEQAIQLGIFGAPTFFVHNEMFWGDDRLEDAIRHAQLIKSREVCLAPGDTE